MQAREHGAGDVAMALVRACDDYEGARWRCGVLLAALALLGLAAFAPPVPAVTLLGAQVVALGAGLALAELAPVRRCFVSPRVLEARARARAAHLFAEQTACEAPGNAVLLFVALFERRVIVLAGDVARHALAPGRSWTEIALPLRDALRRGEVQAGLGAALERCGELLAPPPAPEGSARDTLPPLVTLED